MTQEHSPLDWKVGKTFSTHNHPFRFWETEICLPDGQYICDTKGETREEAEQLASLIVRAVNSHDDLVKALEALETLDKYWTEDFPDSPDGGPRYKKGLGGVLSADTVQLWKQIRAAIAKAKAVSA